MAIHYILIKKINSADQQPVSSFEHIFTKLDSEKNETPLAIAKKDKLN